MSTQSGIRTATPSAGSPAAVERTPDEHAAALTTRGFDGSASPAPSVSTDLTDVDRKSLHNPAKHKWGQLPAPVVVAEQTQRLAEILAAVPASMVALTDHESIWALYRLMGELVHPGRELDAVEYVLRHRARVARGELTALDLRAKIIGSFRTDVRNDRTILTDFTGELEPIDAAVSTVGHDHDEAAIVLDYHHHATGIVLAEDAAAMMATGVCLALAMMLTPPAHGPTPSDPLAALQNSGRAAARGSRLADQLHAAGISALPARSLARMLAGTQRPDHHRNHLTSLLYCAATRYNPHNLPDTVVGRWAADSMDLAPDPHHARGRRRRAARCTAIAHRHTAVDYARQSATARREHPGDGVDLTA